MMNLSNHFVFCSRRIYRVASEICITSITAACGFAVVGTRAAAFALVLGALFSVRAFGTPFSGTPIAVPGTFEAENFDLGGEGIAYHDNTPGNQGGQYRLTEDVDIILSSDKLGGGYVVNNFETGEWLAYTINVAASAQYYIELRASSQLDNSTFHIEIDGQNVTGTVSVPNTGNWKRFQWVGKTGVSLAAGQHLLKIVVDQQYFNLNSIRVTDAPVSTPYFGTPIAVPGSFEAENFDLGGEGVAYHDNTPGNQGGQYRLTEDVDIILSSDALGGGYVVNNFETGEWLAYTVNVATSAQYYIELRASSQFDNSSFHVEIDGQNATGTVSVPNTGSWNTFQWVGKTGVPLPTGQHLLKIVADQQYFDLNSIRVTAVPLSTPYSGTPIAVPGTFEAENFDLGGEGVAYHDNTPGNQGGQYRLNEDVDIILSSDALGGGYVVNNFETGEWLAYTVSVAASAQYDITLRVSSAFSTSAFHIEIDGQNVTGTVSVPNTGSWNTFQWVGKTGVPLAAGQHLLKIVADQQYFNLNSIMAAVTPAPPASPTPVPSVSANLLFSSGFEGTTALLPPSGFYGTGAWQSIVGIDSITGFAWPPNIWGGGPTHSQMIVSGTPIDATTLGNYQVNQIQTVTGHNGTPTQALYSEIMQSGCTGTNPMGSCVDQDAFMLQPVGETSDLYISYWIKYQPDLVQKMNPPSPNWRVLFEWKTGVNGDDGDYRVSAQLVTWGLGGPLSWHMQGDNVASAGSYTQVRYWEQYTTTDAQTLADWMKFEVFWHRSSGADGRVWMAVNGQVILDHLGSNMGVNNAPINRIFMPNLYGSTAFPIYQWIDDLQIWDSFPPDAAPH